VVFYEKEMNSIGSKKHDIFMDVIHFDDKTSWFDSNVFITFIFPVLVFNIPIQFVVLFIVVFVAEFFLNKDAEEPFQIAGSITFTAFIVANIIRFLMQIDLYLFCFFIIVFIRFRKDSLNRSYECKHNEVLQKIRDINGARRNTLSKLNNQWQD
jgi:ABC-type multidrug transport system fused ATPase/permease subunit